MKEYFVSIYNIELERQAVLTTFVSLLWQEGYYSEGTFQLECVLSDELMDLFQLEWYCGLTDHDTLMVIKSVQVENGMIVVNGYPATHIFADRVSTEEVGYEDAGQIFYDLLNNMTYYPRIEADQFYEYTIGVTFDQTTSDHTLQEYFEKIAQACDVGFRLYHDKSEQLLHLIVYQPGENENAKYSTNYGNLGDISYEHSSVDYKNVAVVAGQGEGDDRVTVFAGDTDAEGADRREMYVDARQEQQEEDETDDEYETRLIEYGEEKLLEQLETESISFTVDDDDVALGDIVYCHITEIGLDIQARVTVIEEVYQDNVMQKTLTVGTPIILRRY